MVKGLVVRVEGVEAFVGAEEMGEEKGGGRRRRRRRRGDRVERNEDESESMVMYWVLTGGENKGDKMIGNTVWGI